MNILQKIKDYLEESAQIKDLISPESLLEEINTWEAEDDNS